MAAVRSVMARNLRPFPSLLWGGCQRRCASSVGSSSWFEVVGGPLNMKGSGKSISHELLLTETHGSEPMRIHALQGYISTLYVAEYPERAIQDRWLLLDSGMPNDVRRVHAFLQHTEKKRTSPGLESALPSADGCNEHGASNDGAVCPNPKVVVCTHCHIDHFGAADRWLHAGSHVAMASEMHAFYSGIGGRLQEGVDTVLSMLVAHRLGRHFERPSIMPLFLRNSWQHVCQIAKRLQADRKRESAKEVHHALLTELDDGHCVPFFEDWISIKCPGHTDHMILLYHPVSHILYVADFFVAPRTFRFQPPVPVDIDYAYSHSLHRLRKLPVRYALLAHGGIVDMDDVGGWDFVLDAVVERFQSPVSSRRSAIRLIDKLMFFTTAPSAYSRDRLPSRPLPEAAQHPSPITYIKHA